MREYKGIERRKYIRLQSVFPVGFKLLSLDGQNVLSEALQGFTADVSKGGILLRANNLDSQLTDMIEKKTAKISLDIEIPVGSKPIEAISSVVWIRIIREAKKSICFIGLSFEKIGDKDRRRLVGYAGSLYRAPKLMAALLLAMLIALGSNRADEIKLRRKNRLIVQELGEVIEKRSAILELIEKASQEKGLLLTRLELQEENVAMIEEEKRKLAAKEKELNETAQDMEILKAQLDMSRRSLESLEALLQEANSDKESLDGKLAEIALQEEKRKNELRKIEEKRKRLEEATVENMYRWLKSHQNRRTGLVTSYEGDSALKNTAFTYDQALIAQVFLLEDDAESAKSIFDFYQYKAKRYEGGFVNAYASTNGAVIEGTVHCGPNLWLGIALMQYMDKTGDKGYLMLAKDIGDWVIDIQKKDSDYGIRGGPDVAWYSTEHNLDAYAYFEMLYEKTGDIKYREAADRTLSWIARYAYTGSGGRIRRGKGDSTIATDTFAWSIAAIGPKTLLDVGMDPDAIMKFAEDNCKTAVDFVRPDGKIVKVTGFDFAKHKNLGRGGVVSSEWTAQMIVSLKMMSNFYLDLGDNEKAGVYYDKAQFYLNELEKMVITSPSRSGQGGGCLPYATQGNADTGHGWRTPGGKDTGSVSGTAYGVFAIKGYNPLKLPPTEN
ncbi:MAG: PilZ domain-containing protein [Candidatus Omnitrophica bacterium]|nr:PilZ domain-containing protein [Candidatus Omnitrophota bacterium]